MSEVVDTLVIGAGQAGLAMSHALAERGVEHLVVERGRVGERWWSERWDSLLFQFPNWSLRLPGLDYAGADPDGFASHSEVGARIVDYAAMNHAPVRTGVEVASLRVSEAGFRADTSSASISARTVVLATGPFQRPHLPALTAAIPPSVVQLHSIRYRNPPQLPPGAVLVVGSGGSGAQIAEELASAGRAVYLALSRHRRVPRRRRGQDVLWWLLELGWMDRLAASLPAGRLPPTLLVTGVDGGHDLDLRRLPAHGVVLLGRLLGVDGTRLLFHDDAAAILAAADAGFDELAVAIDDHARRAGLHFAHDEAEPISSRSADAPTSVDIDKAGIRSIVWCTGYSYDYDWVHVPCFDQGAPVQQRGVSRQDGLYFLGLHWMHTFKSGVSFGVGDDAAYLAHHIAHAADQANRPLTHHRQSRERGCAVGVRLTSGRIRPGGTELRVTHGYAYEHGWTLERVRLAGLEAALDPGTRAHLARLGAGPGTRCLEVGAGRGSVAFWLAERVAPGGTVLATDLDTDFLESEAAHYQGLEVLRHDITAEQLPGGFDIVHARWLVEWLPDKPRALRRMVDALRPGGVLLIEEPDFVTIYEAADPPALRHVMRAAIRHLELISPIDGEYGRRAMSDLRTVGLADVQAEGRCPVVPGGSPLAAGFLRLTIEKLRAPMLAGGAITEDDYAQAVAALQDPSSTIVAPMTVAAWGAKP